jgi:hypothetical protein
MKKRAVLRHEVLELLKEELEKVSMLFDKDLEISRARGSYQRELRVGSDVMGLPVDYLAFYDEGAECAGSKEVGRCLSIIYGSVFDKDPIFASDLDPGPEPLVGELVANMTVFGLGNLLSLYGIDPDFEEVELDIPEGRLVLRGGAGESAIVWVESGPELDEDRIVSEFLKKEYEGKAEGGCGMWLRGAEHLFERE